MFLSYIQFLLSYFVFLLYYDDFYSFVLIVLFVFIPFLISILPFITDYTNFFYFCNWLFCFCYCYHYYYNYYCYYYYYYYYDYDYFLIRKTNGDFIKTHTGINIFILDREPALCMLSVQQSSHVLLRSFVISFLHSEISLKGEGTGTGTGRGAGAGKFADIGNILSYFFYFISTIISILYYYTLL